MRPTIHAALSTLPCVSDPQPAAAYRTAVTAVVAEAAAAETNRR